MENFENSPKVNDKPAQKPDLFEAADKKENANS